MKRINNDFVSAYQKTASWHNRQHQRKKTPGSTYFFGKNKTVAYTLQRAYTVVYARTPGDSVCQQWKCVWLILVPIRFPLLLSHAE